MINASKLKIWYSRRGVQGKVALFTYHLLLTPNESEMKKKLLAAYSRPLMYPFLNPKAHSIETFHHRYVYICLCTRWSIPSKCSTTRQNVPKLKFYICVGRGMGWDCEGRFAFALVFPFYPPPQVNQNWKVTLWITYRPFINFWIISYTIEWVKAENITWLFFN